MGMLLSFAPLKAAKPRPKPTTGETASIIIFPGVRYEKLKGAGAAARRPKPDLARPPVQY